jgi:hypothetical protein
VKGGEVRFVGIVACVRRQRAPSQYADVDTDVLDERVLDTPSGKFWP